MTDPILIEAADGRLRALFDSWDAAGIRVCIWKSADRWEEGLAGNTDFDLLLSPHDLEPARQILLNHNWLPVDAESWRSFDGLSDYISLQDQGNHHIHLHTQIVSGEKLIKSLRPPLTELYLAEAQATYPPFVKSELEFIIFIVRVIVKISWIDRLGAVRRRSASSLYRNYFTEYKPLRDAAQYPLLQQLLEQPQLSRLPADVILAAHEDLAAVDWRARREVRKAIAPWRNVSGLAAWWGVMKRVYEKRKLGVGKPLKFPAPTVALCGADGSGKTTLADALEKHLSRHLKVSRFYMGSNIEYAERWRRAASRATWIPYLLTRTLCKILGLHKAQRVVEGRYAAFSLDMQRRQKAYRLREATHAGANGNVVLFERYPLFTPFGDDLTPSLVQASPMPDLLVMLEVSQSTALARRGDDPVEEIKAKVIAFREATSRLQAQGEQVLVCAEAESVDERVEKIVKALNEILVQRAQALG